MSATELTEHGAVRLDPPELVATSQRSQGRFVVLASCRTVRLTQGALQLLLALMAAQGDRANEGFLCDRSTAYATAIHRLRCALDQELGAGAGNRIIQTGVGGEYRLAPQLSAAVDARLLQLRGVAPCRLVALLAGRCRVLQETELGKLLSDCNPPA